VTSIQMPQLGETIVEGTILKWLKAEGEPVARDEPLFEISTDKVDTEVPSPVAGTVSKILVAEGATVPVGTALMEIDEGGSATSEASGGEASSAYSATTPPPEPAATPEAGVVASGASSAPPPAAAQVPEPAGTAAGVAVSTTPVPDRGPRSQILSPIVRKLAREHDLDLAQIAGTGSGGRITKADVLAVIAAGGTAPAAPAGVATSAAAPALAMPAPAAGTGEQVVPISHIRRAIAEHMLASTQTSARAWTLVEVNVDHLVRLRERVKDAFAERYGVKLTYLPMVVRATADALLEFPDVNARLDGESIVRHRYVNMGIAVSYDAGLIVPVVKGVDGMNTIGIARAIADLAARARSHQLQPDEVQGATFTITNPGPYGSVASVPIINQPNAGILSFDAIVKRAVVMDDAIAIRSMVNLSMSWDHRIIDGELATRFLARVKQNLETWDFAEDLGV
jgi:pyruvate dehydrogenase E2 component (dihydrolipoamide acetyltransferase)